LGAGILSLSRADVLNRRTRACGGLMAEQLLLG